MGGGMTVASLLRIDIGAIRVADCVVLGFMCRPCCNSDRPVMTETCVVSPRSSSNELALDGWLDDGAEDLIRVSVSMSYWYQA